MNDSAAPATLRVRLALLIIVLFFGGSLPGYKLASESFGPATINLMRFAIAALILVIAARSTLSGVGPQWRPLLAVGAGGIGLMALLMSIGVDRGSAIIGSVIVGLEPIGVALAGVLLVGDRPTMRSMLALFIGFAGALVASGLLTEKSGPSPVVPIILLFGTVVAFSLYTALVRRAGAGVPPLAVTASTQIGALGLIIPAVLFDIADRGMVRGDITPKAVGAVIFVGIGSAISYLLLVSVLSSQPSSRVAVTLFLTPVIGVLLSWIVVGEDLRWRHALGAAIVLGAVWLSEGGGSVNTPPEKVTASA